MLYTIIKKILFSFDPETAHKITLSGLDWAHRVRLLPILFPSWNSSQSVEVMGLTFPNRIGLAAGLDKNGDHIDSLSALGFGFIEVGTVTPRPQIGNPRPRLFRLTSDKAIINRMGFNNYGVDHLVANIKKSKYRGIVGVNIGKNADTLINQSVNDYLLCMKKVYQYAHYITINISSPNTKQLRELQNRQELESLINAVKNEQRSLEAEYKKYVPVVIKIAPDLESGQISEMASLFLQFEVDGVIATNTTVSRSGLIDARLAEQVGGLSGAPLKERSTDVLRALVDALGGKIPVIASGGVMNAQDVVDKLDAGASLVQLYSGLVYTGPTLIRESVDAVNRYESRS